VSPFDPATLELLPDPTVVIDADGTVVGVNDLAARLVGRPADALLGSVADEAIPLRDEQQADWWACMRAVEGAAALLRRIPEHDVSLLRPDGARRPVIVTGARIVGADGGLEGMVVALRRGERRARLDAARSELVSTVSHELRSPLTSVKGFTKTLLAKWDRFNDDQKQQMLRTVNEDADRVTRLLSELLDVSRIDAGKLQLRRQMVDVGEVVRRVCGRLAAHVDDRELVPDVGPEVPKLYADPDKIEQVVTNLAENALKYGEGSIRVFADVRDEEVEFVVSDEGAGIPSASLSSIFGKFFRHASERRSGTGLGLYISKGIVDAHGGRIWATSPPGEGARFHFTLPRGGLELAGIDVGGRRR